MTGRQRRKTLTTSSQKNGTIWIALKVQQCQWNLLAKNIVL